MHFIDTKIQELKQERAEHLAEYDRAIRALEGARAHTQQALPAPANGQRNTRGRRRSGRRTRISGEQRREQLLTLARENPDIKPAEIAVRLGTTKNNVYNLIRRVEQAGTIERRDGRIVVR